MCFRPSHSSFKGSNVEAQISFSQGALLVPWLFCCRSLGFQLGIRSVFTVNGAQFQPSSQVSFQ